MICPSELRLDQLVVGELAVAVARETRTHVAECLPCRRRVADIERERVAFVHALPRRRAPWVAGISAAAAAAAIVVVATRGGGEEPGNRTKGSGEHMSVYVEHRGHVHQASLDERVEPGDKLQMTLTLREARHISLFGTDATGATTVYFEGRLDAGTDIPLPNSIILDGTLGRESYVVLFCAAPLTACTTDTFGVVK